MASACGGAITNRRLSSTRARVQSLDRKTFASPTATSAAGFTPQAIGLSLWSIDEWRREQIRQLLPRLRFHAQPILLSRPARVSAAVPGSGDWMGATLTSATTDS